MSMTDVVDAMRPEGVAKITPQALLRSKHTATPITALTAYDYPTARLIDEAGIDLVLVGDSLGMAVLGYDTTLHVTLDDMVHHGRAVRRGTHRAMVVVDMPYGSYQVSVKQAVRNAVRLIKETGCEAVKLEGGAGQATRIQALTEAEIPVIAHVGLTPQSVHRMGGYRVQGTSEQAAAQLREDALVLENAGAIAIVLEAIPRELATLITADLKIPTIGIGAGPDCDGQILVFHDLCALSFGRRPKFVRTFVDARTSLVEGILQFRTAVQERTFPRDAESYHMPGSAMTTNEPAVKNDKDVAVCA